MRRVLFALTAFVMTAGPAAATPEGSAFTNWVAEFKREALAQGVSSETFDAAFEGVAPNPRVIERDSDQPEFVKPIWEYLDIAASDARIANGRTQYDEHAELLNDIEAQYGVNAEVIAAIWGLESSYGAITGSYDVIEALATLAFDGRRTAFGRRELLSALTILENGYANKDQLKGSWAGAMGQPQFIPSTYLAYAVDYDGDGRRDLWTNLGDIFASTANYLKEYGWARDQAAMLEVVLPDGFDYAEADLRQRKPLSDWMELGVAFAGVSEAVVAGLDDDASAAIIIPAGANGPAFLVLDNFRTIMRYNNSTAYALGVSALATAIEGEDWRVAKAWPLGERPLNREERIALQKSLADQGYDPGAADGILGARTRAALRAFQQDNGLTPDGFATKSVLEKVRTGS